MPALGLSLQRNEVLEHINALSTLLNKAQIPPAREYRLRPCILQHVRQLIHASAEVDRHEHRIQLRRSEIRLDVLVAVHLKHSHAVTRAHAHICQRIRKPVHPCL